jgi:CHASE3 domain sensor protein
MEVLQEEEIKEMKKQQDNFKTMMDNDNSEIKKMEEQERKRMEAYETKKSVEK